MIYSIQAHVRRIAELAVKSRLPTMHPFRFEAEAAGLMSYGADLVDARNDRSAGRAY